MRARQLRARPQIAPRALRRPPADGPLSRDAWVRGPEVHERDAPDEVLDLVSGPFERAVGRVRR